MKWLFCVFLFVSSIVAQSQSSILQTRIDKLLENEFYQRAAIGIAVYDLTAQEMVYTHNEKKLCRPASNMKLLTSAAALTVLTSRYVFKTDLYYTGDIDSTGLLNGDIYIIGGFDPELRTVDLDTLISKMKKIGINNIKGNLYLDTSMADSTHWGQAWCWDDDMEPFQPYLSAIPLNKGVARLKISPAAIGEEPTITIAPETNFIKVVNRAQTIEKSTETSEKTLKFAREFVDGSNVITVSGSIAAKAKDYETSISLKNPYDFVLTVFLEKIAENFPESVILTSAAKQVPADAQIIGYVSHYISDVIRRLNKNSDNLNAEMCLYAMGYKQGSRPASLIKGAYAVQTFITKTGLSAKGYNIVDGSGLSNYNYVSPELIVAVLRYMHKSPYFDMYKKSLPVAGVDGTLTSRMKNTKAHRNAAAKTGSMTGVCALSGYVTGSNGHLMAFSILVQNFVDRSSVVSVNFIDKICEAIAQ